MAVVPVTDLNTGDVLTESAWQSVEEAVDALDLATYRLDAKRDSYVQTIPNSNVSNNPIGRAITLVTSGMDVQVRLQVWLAKSFELWDTASPNLPDTSDDNIRFAYQVDNLTPVYLIDGTRNGYIVDPRGGFGQYGAQPNVVSFTWNGIIYGLSAASHSFQLQAWQELSVAVTGNIIDRYQIDIREIAGVASVAT